MALSTASDLDQQQLHLLDGHWDVEVVKIFLNAAIACIAHTRELIPWVSPCFETRYIDQLQINTDDADSIYDKFCRGPMVEETGSKSQEFRVLQKGKDKRADRILDMIENGVGDSLQKQFLAALQIFITADAKDPSSVFEVYSFSFSYTDGSVSRITVSSRTANNMLVQSVHRSFATSIKALLRSLKDLPRLPRKRSLGMTLLYHQDCPQDYQAPGFLDLEEDQQSLIQNSICRLWQYMPTSQFEFEVGRQKVSVGARRLRFDIEGRRCHLQDIDMSTRIQKMQRTSSLDHDLTSTAKGTLVQIKHPQQQYTAATPLTTTESKTTDTKSSPCKSQQPKAGPILGSINGHAAPKSSKISTKGVNELAKLTVAYKNRRRRNVEPLKVAEMIVQAKAMENEHHGLDELFDASELQDGRVRRLDNTGAVRCECGSRHDIDSMLQCDLCGTRQHVKCYGYEGLRQGCLPEDHFCYECLLLPREEAAAQAMPGVVHMRLAFMFLAKQPTAEIEIGQEFLRAVFYDREDATTDFLELINRLVKEGYLNKCKDDVWQVTDNAKLDAAQNDYLDPLAGIRQHYRIIRDGDSMGKRQKEVLKALDMYVGDRYFSLEDNTNSLYDQVHVKNNNRQEVIRWGFYAKEKRKAGDSPHQSMARRKVSVSSRFVDVSRHASAEPSSMSQAISEATVEGDWDLRFNSRLSSAETDLQ